MLRRQCQGRSRSGDAAEESRWTYWGIALLLAIVVLPYERFIGPASLRLVDGIIVLLTLYTAVSFWRSRQRLVFPLLLPMWLIIMSSLVAALLGFAYMTNFMAILQEIYLWIVLVVVTNLLLRHNVGERDRLLKLWAIVACVIALTTLMGMLHIGPSMFYEIPQRDRYQFEGFDRGVGTYINPNAAAAYLSSSFFIAVGAPLPKWGRVVACSWIFAGIYATGSNGAMGTTLLALGLLIMVYTILRRRRTALGWALALTGGTAVSTLLLDKLPTLLSGGTPVGGGLFSTSARRAVRALMLRMQLWRIGWREFQKRPWGFGPNSASEIQASLHSDYLAFLFERGPVGFLGWTLLLLEPLIYVMRAAGQSQADKLHQWQVLALGAGFLANGINAAVHELSHTRPLWLLMAFIFAQSISILELTKQKRLVAVPIPSARGLGRGQGTNPI
ncbi:MAG: hypothetical protein GY805_08145 [Chloroflexi bacterium]|nr:hypothetical protein [Chloroflexota bacterium]